MVGGDGRWVSSKHRLSLRSTQWLQLHPGLRCLRVKRRLDANDLFQEEPCRRPSAKAEFESLPKDRPLKRCPCQRPKERKILKFWSQIMIPDLKDNRLVCNLRGGNLEVDSVVVGWVGRALHLVACLHLLM